MRSDLSIRPATLSDIPGVRALADIAFRKTYADILSADQMEYMMDWMYSERSLRCQIERPGKYFFIAELDDEAVGYVSYERDGLLGDGRTLFHLQKLYVLPQYHGMGIGSAMVAHVRNDIMSRGENPARVELNVNRGNPAVRFYERIGMRRERQGDFPIGCGYYMNDYIYSFDI